MNMKKAIRIIALVLVATAAWLYLKGKKTTAPISKEKVLVTASISPIKTLDPIQSDDSYSSREVAKVYEGLLEFHYLKRPLELVPNLAEAMPIVSENQLVYTFKIKPGIMFHDNVCFPNGKGRELTVHDFIYSFKRLADPKQQARNLWLIDGKIKGVTEWREKYANVDKVDYTDEIEGIKALDRYTLEFTLSRPYPQFLSALAMVGCSVVPHEAVEHYGPEFMNHPVGTGPFMIETFNPQDTQIVYHKNPNFRDKRFPNEAAEEYKHILAYAGKKLPLVDKIITHIIPEEQPRWLKFQKGQIDILDLTIDKTAATVLGSNNELIPSLQTKGMKLLQVPGISTTYLILNNSLELFRNNPKLRQAISMSLDLAGYNKLFYEGRALIAESTVPPGLAGYQKDYVNPYRVYDVKKAKQYLAEAGYPDGKGLPELTLDIPTGTTPRQKGEFFQKCLSKIGIKVKIIENIFPELIKKLGNKATMLHNMTWSADYPDAENFFHLFYGPNEPGIGAYFNDPTFNDLYEKASVMNDSPARTVLYERLNQIIAEQLPAICFIHPKNIFIQQGWVKNYCWSDFHYGTEQYFDVDMDQREALISKL
jgi:ABC-type transport system substrate-binding protein